MAEPKLKHLERTYTFREKLYTPTALLRFLELQGFWKRGTSSASQLIILATH